MTDADPNLLALVRDKADGWARDLIELNARTNTLLSFTPGRGAGVDLSAADPAALSDLYAGARTRLSVLLTDEQQRIRASRQVRLFRTRAAQLDEEQGFDAGRLAVGIIATADTRARTGVLTMRAPVLLSRVTVSPVGAGEQDFTLELGDDLEPNPILPYVLERGFRLDVDVDALEAELAEEVVAAADRDDAVDRVYRTVAKAAEHGGVGLHLIRGAALGLFSYEKFPMVQDLRTATELLARSDTVTAVAGHAAAQRRLGAAAEASSIAVGDDVPPRDEYLVLDADSSQQHAINAVGAGRNAVIVGPPGTGKSQTIANIIAVAAAKGRSVLFVAEKRAAIEAVTERLAQVDLGGLVFDLHQKKIKKRDVALQLAATLERAGRERLPDVEQLHRRLDRARRQASDHARLLHSPVEPWGLTPFQVQDGLLAMAGRGDGGPLLPGRTLTELRGPVLEGVLDDLKTYMYAGGLRVRRRESPWAAAKVRDEEHLREVLGRLDDVHGRALRSSQHDLDEIVRVTGFVRPGTLADWRQMFSLLADVGRTVDELGPSAFAPDLDARVAATAPRRSADRNLVPLRRRDRRQLRKQAEAASASGLRKAALHARLMTARQQRDWWAQLSAGRGGPHQVVGLADALQRFEDVRNSLAAVAACISIQDLERQPTQQVDATMEALHADRSTFRQIRRINQITDHLERLGLGQLLDHLAARDAQQDGLDPQAAADIIQGSWLRSLEQEFALQLPAFREFIGARHDEVVAEFRTADGEHLRRNRQRVRRAVAERLRSALDAHPDQGRLVKKEAGKKSRHLPLRSLVSQASDVLLAAHPCWAMSPLVVSQMLPAQQLFDLVIFDEASQIEPQEAVTSIMRGRQLVVAGDPKQLPPSRMFQRLSVDEPDAEDEADDNLDQYESILNVLQPLLPEYLLRWHYRSRDERLIAFANREIYGGELVTFAGCSAESPVRLEVVDGSVAPGQSGVALAEVARVVELVLQHARTRPNESLGVIAFGSTQSEAIEGALREARIDSPDLQEFEARHDGPGRRLFVKNLERVQGDERDAVILSIGRAKTASGKVALRFGALNNEGGERRLNVAITRAKRRMTVVSSFGAHEMAPNATRHKGPELLRQFLEYAGSDHRLDVIGRQRTGVDLNGFERSVLDALVARGLTVHPQWGVGEYAIDFALAHPDQPGRMVLAVEADGDRYHRTYAARDRDRLRQAHLESLGWRFVRVWSTDWFRDAAAQTDRIVAAWKAAVEAADQPTAEVVTRPSVPVEPVDSEMVAEPRRGPCPIRGERPTITDYTESELVRLFRWLLSDGYSLDREVRIAQAMEQLRFRKRGSRIVTALTSALERAHQLEGSRS
jgi:very-short-patch-repair endonuclease